MYIYLVIVILLLGLIYYLYKKNNLICLMYHNVLLKSVPGIIGEEEFEHHMEYIKNLTTFKIEELNGMKYKLPKNSILVTFDDGYKNNYTNAFPILKKYNIKATIFLNTKYIGTDESYLNWDEIKEMYQSGLIDFQMHTHSHMPTIRKTEIKGFFGIDEGEYVKREYFSIFNKCFNKLDFREIDFTDLPVFKIRSQISINGYSLKSNFFDLYKIIVNSKEYSRLTVKQRKKYLNKEFKINREKYFDRVSDKEFNDIVKFEILENKNQIEKQLNKKVDYLAYPWGHKYNGKRKDIEKYGIKGFIFTTGGINSRNINYKKILRVNGDAIQEYNKFKSKISHVYK